MIFAREEHVSRAAVVMTDGSSVMDYAALDDASIRLADRFRRAGLRPGDRCAILMENRAEWIVAMWAARRAELRYVPINWHLQAGEVAHVLADSDARALLTSAPLAELARAAARGLPAIELRIAVGGAAGFDDWDAALAAASPVKPATERDGALMPYSSGTTGAPKGILRALPDQAFGTANALESLLAKLYRIGRDAVYLSPAPMYHASPVGFANAVLVAGGTIVLMPAFDAEAALAAIERHRVTHAQFVPTHLVRLLRLPPDVRARYDLSSLVCVIHAAAPCPPDVKRAAIDWFGPIVHEYYAGSERCGFTAIDAAEWLAHPGSVGRSRTGAIHVLDFDTGAELPAGEIGQIWFENAVPFAYHKDAAKTAEALDPRGWGSHGDVGHVDEDGYLYLADRRSDLILSGGVNIYPQEVENALLRHPAVADAAVVGAPDPEYGQRVEAFVQLLPGPVVDQTALIGWVRTEIAPFKAPRRITFTDALPRLPNGKLLRRRLVEEDAR